MTPTNVHAVAIILMLVVTCLAVFKRIRFSELFVALILIGGADIGLGALLMHQDAQAAELQGTFAVLYKQAPALVLGGLALMIAWLMFVAPLRGMFHDSQR